jgi:hypothetical protein
MFHTPMKIGNLRQIRTQKSEIRKMVMPAVLSAFCFLLSALPLRAADLQVSAALDRSQVALNEQAVLNVTVSGSGNLPSPELPGLPEFQIQNAGRSQSFSWINGQASASTTYTYVLTPLKEGHFQIPPVQVQANGQKAATSELALDVVKGDPGSIPAPAPSPNARAAAQQNGPAALSIRAIVDKNTVYVGEPVQFIFRLYNRVPLLSNPNYQPPQTPGFIVEDLPPQRSYKEMIKGIPYNVTEVHSALFPVSAGKARIGSATLNVHVENLSADPFSPDFFSSFFGHGEEKTLRTEPISITVRPLPEPKPAGFKGAVGRYTLTSSVDKETVSVGQPVTLSITIAGHGSIKSLPDIEIPTVQNFRTFDTTAATNIDKKNYEVSGSKIFKTLLIPTTSGDLRIPSVSFSFFDPELKQYKTLSSRAFTIHVTPGSGAPNVPLPTLTPSAPAAAPGIRMLGEDIRYIQKPASVHSQGKPLYRNLAFIFFNLLLVLGVAGTGIYYAIRRLFLSDETQTRFRAAAAKALQHRDRAEAAVSRSDLKAAAEELADGLHGYLANKLGLDERGIGLKQVITELKTRGVHPHEGEKVRNLWESLDLYLFAPSQARPEELRQAARTFEHVIEELDKEIVWKD